MADTQAAQYDYARQTAFAPLGQAGQRRLKAARVLLVGVGGLGSWMAELLARSGVGLLRLVDDDRVSQTNLHRQTLYTPRDAANSAAKVTSAAQRLTEIAPHVAVEPHCDRLTPANAAQLAAGVDLILDGTDNFPARFLINDLAVREGIPWVLAGAAGAVGQVMAVRPGSGACLRCLYESPPPPEMELTAQTLGVIPPIVAGIASLAAGEAFKLLTQESADCSQVLLQLDMWQGTAKRLSPVRREECPCCSRRCFPFLEPAR